MTADRKRIFGLRGNQIGGMALCVILSVFILIFGRHDVESLPTEATGSVDVIYEGKDGDLDFGGMEDIIADANHKGQSSQNLDSTQSGNPDSINSDPLSLQDDNFFYSITKGSATVTECVNPLMENAVIPKTIQGYPVETIGEYLFQGNTKLQHVEIPEGVKEIRWNAFENCTALETVSLPTSLTTICECAFWNSGLLSVTIPDTVRVVEDYAFAACENLTELTLAFTKNLSAIFDMSCVTKVTLQEGVSVIEEEAFDGAESLKEVILPSTLTIIKAYAFYNCISIEKLKLPDSVVSIGANAFENCYSLREVKMPKGLLLLSEYAFYSCWSLQEIEIPSEITTIQDSVFEDCEQILLLVYPGSLGEEYAQKNQLLYEVH